jgi:formylglycine-generating enzyme required for sulfatase activity
LSATLDGVLRWDDLSAAQQRTVEQLLGWVLTTLTVTPASAQEPVNIPLSCLAPADGPNGAPVWMGRTEVTVDDYRGLLGTLPNAKPDSDMAARGDHPVGYVTQDETVQFCNNLYDAAGIADLVIRLPYAREWERACLAGRGHLLDAMPDLRHYDAESGALTLAIDRANFDSRELSPTMASHADGFATFAPVGSYAPNAWQLDDILGNVRELVKVDINRLEGRGSGFTLSVEPSDLTKDPFQREPQTSGLRPLEDVGFRIVVQWLE